MLSQNLSKRSLKSRFFAHFKALVPKADEQDYEPLWQDIAQRYSESQRYYHTLDHLAYIFANFDSIVVHLREPHLIGLALFYHDVIYDPKRKPEDKSNEVKSADYAERQLADYLSPAQVKRLSTLILMTESHQLSDAADLGNTTFDSDAAYLLDLDLSTLGAPSPDYDAYARAVRQEYQHIPDRLYQMGRTAVLKSLLAHSRLYVTPYFYERLEQQARQNISQELAALRAR